MKLNADLGEHEPPTFTEALMRLIDLANVACGGHAGTPESMEHCVRLALEHGVEIGAHPGLSENFGRGEAEIDASALEELVVEQTKTLATVAAALGARLNHVKLHGSLYHAVENSDVLSHRYVEIMKKYFPELKIVVRAGGKILPAAKNSNVIALAEVFADRGYRTDGTLIPRGEPGALLHDPVKVVARLSTLRGDTICVHADSSNALRIAKAVRAALH